MRLIAGLVLALVGSAPLGAGAEEGVTGENAGIAAVAEAVRRDACRTVYMADSPIYPIAVPLPLDVRLEGKEFVARLQTYDRATRTPLVLWFSGSLIGGKATITGTSEDPDFDSGAGDQTSIVVEASCRQAGKESADASSLEALRLNMVDHLHLDIWDHLMGTLPDKLRVEVGNLSKDDSVTFFIVEDTQQVLLATRDPRAWLDEKAGVPYWWFREVGDPREKRASAKRVRRSSTVVTVDHWKPVAKPVSP